MFLASEPEKNSYNLEAAYAEIEALQTESAACESSMDENPLLRLQHVFGLDAFEIEVLFLALAAELDNGFGRVFAYLHDNISRKLPGVELALNIMGPSYPMEHIHYFGPAGRLRRYALIQVLEEEHQSFQNALFRLDNRIRGFLTGDNSLPEELAPVLEIRHCHNFDLSELAGESLARAQNLSTQSGPNIFWLYGKESCREKIKTAEALAFEFGRPLLEINLGEASWEQADVMALMRDLFKEACLQDGILLFLRGDTLANNTGPGLRRPLLENIKSHKGHVLIEAEDPGFPKALKPNGI